MDASHRVLPVDLDLVAAHKKNRSSSLERARPGQSVLLQQDCLAASDEPGC